MSSLVDQFGYHLAPPAKPAAPVPGRRVRANLGNYGGAFPYEAASWTDNQLGGWLPWIRSPDSEINVYRDRMVARQRDIVRNDGWAAGSIRGILDETIGIHFHLVSKPDYRALAAISGLKAFDAEWADEFGQAVEARWRIWANDPAHNNDVTRQLTLGQQLRLGLRHKLVDGENAMVLYVLPDRIAATGFSTAALGVDPDLLSNPYQQLDTKYMRGGVEVDDLGVPVAYHFRKAHQNDWYNAVESNEWVRVTRETADGWQRVIHDFERDRFGQNKGVGIFAPVLARLKMLTRYDATELQAALIAATISTFITSPYDPQMVRDALSTDEGIEELRGYQSIRDKFHSGHPLAMMGARIPLLAPGETIESVAASHPSTNFDAFEHNMLRGIAAQTGQSAEQVSKDWSKTNYSSARGALLEAWKTISRRRGEFTAGTCDPLYCSWLDEGMDAGYFPLPGGAPDFIAARAAYARCRWLGPGRGFIDPVKEAQATILRMDAGLTTLEQESADLTGSDWRENVEQRALEIKRFRDLGIPLPEWSGTEVASVADEKPQPQ